jgi:hypothetical protein
MMQSGPDFEWVGRGRGLEAKHEDYSGRVQRKQRLFANNEELAKPLARGKLLKPSSTEE